ncbi:MAG: glycosyltransferase, partial [Acidimicrobiia bacterium]|nr:glycosyltransferase [Acidimicrobiia bacterium]
RMAWRSIREELSAADIASVLYLREEAAIGHLDISNAPPDLLLANAATLTERAAAIGFSAQFVPSVVSLDGIRVDTTREVVLFINPVEISGRGVAVALARECPETRFAFLESWPLKPEERRWLADTLVGLANVELRPRTDDPNELYGDAAVLLAPYLTNGRPRVVLEAQANGVPVLGSSLDALVEAIGPGGLTVDADAPIAEWATALRYLLSPTNYDGFVAAARTYSERSEVDPEMIVGEFETLLLELMTTRGGAS